jgi:hypothetical protein
MLYLIFNATIYFKSSVYNSFIFFCEMSGQAFSGLRFYFLGNALNAFKNNDLTKEKIQQIVRLNGGQVNSLPTKQVPYTTHPQLRVDISRSDRRPRKVQGGKNHTKATPQRLPNALECRVS